MVKRAVHHGVEPILQPLELLREVYLLMARAGARAEPPSPDPAERPQLLDHRLRSADVPRRHRRQAVCHALVTVEVVEIVSLGFVRHAQHFTPKTFGRQGLWLAQQISCCRRQATMIAVMRRMIQPDTAVMGLFGAGTATLVLLRYPDEANAAGAGVWLIDLMMRSRMILQMSPLSAWRLRPRRRRKRSRRRSIGQFAYSSPR